VRCPSDHDPGPTADGVADNCCARQYFQNKIFEIYLNPNGIDTCNQYSGAYRHRCINEFCKSPYIVYRGFGEPARRRLSCRDDFESVDCHRQALQPQIGPPRPPQRTTGASAANLPGTWGGPSSSRSRRGARRLGAIPKNCHLLPFSGRKTATPVSTVPFLAR
jgi:hypothetical protein